MTEVKLSVTSPNGMHARPAGALVKTLSSFQSTVEIVAKGQKKNAKSIMSLLSLGLGLGDEISFLVSGPDEVEVAKEIQKWSDASSHA